MMVTEQQGRNKERIIIELNYQIFIKANTYFSMSYISIIQIQM